MPDDNSAREIARRIVDSADSLAYLAEALGKTKLPDAWRYGPAFEIRLRFRTRLQMIDDVELARRLDALGISGPLRANRLAMIAERLTLQPGDLIVTQSWRPRCFGLWRLDDGTAFGVKIYMSSRPAVDLLLAIPPNFLKSFSARSGFAYWKRLSDRPEDLGGLTRLCNAMLMTLRRAQPVAQLEAVHIQDQTWCAPLDSDDRGLVVPQIVAARLRVPTRESTRDGWANISLD